MLLQAKLEDVKKLYADQIKDLEAMKVTRPAKPVAAEKVRFDTDQCLLLMQKELTTTIMESICSPPSLPPPLPLPPRLPRLKPRST